MPRRRCRAGRPARVGESFPSRRVVGHHCRARRSCSVCSSPTDTSNRDGTHDLTSPTTTRRFAPCGPSSGLAASSEVHAPLRGRPLRLRDGDGRASSDLTGGATARRRGCASSSTRRPPTSRSRRCAQCTASTRSDAFLRGFYAGDGLKKGNGLSITTNSPVLAQGLCWLYAPREPGRLRLRRTPRRQDLLPPQHPHRAVKVGMQGPAPAPRPRRGAALVDDRTRPGDEWVFDLETECGVFAAGVGRRRRPQLPAPRARVRDAQDHLARGGDQARAGATSCGSGTSTPSATGAMRSTTSRRCG